jgi:hypothetical protein
MATGKFPESHWAVLVEDGKKMVSRVRLTFRIWYEDGAWQGLCTELGVPSFADEVGTALDSVIDATIGYLNEIEATGEREHIFAERGLTLRDGEPTGDSDTADKEVRSGETVSRLEVGLSAVAS